MKAGYKYANQIKKRTGIDVFSESRKRPIVEHRALLVYLLRSVEKCKFYTIRDFFRKNNKRYDHATALYAYNNYKMYATYNKELESLFYKLINYSDSKMQRIKIITDMLESLPTSELVKLEHQIQEYNENNESTNKQSERKPEQSEGN